MSKWTYILKRTVTDLHEPKTTMTQLYDITRLIHIAMSIIIIIILIIAAVFKINVYYYIIMSTTNSLNNIIYYKAPKMHNNNIALSTVRSVRLMRLIIVRDLICFNSILITISIFLLYNILKRNLRSSLNIRILNYTYKILRVMTHCWVTELRTFNNINASINYSQ